MTGHAGGSSGAATVAAAAAAMRSADTRFGSHLDRHHRRESQGCWGGFSCFGSDKRTKRVVPSSRVPEGNVTANSGNGSITVGLPNQSSALAPSLLAPPSSPASFTNSALASTAQSPSCFLSVSANSPGEPSSTMFATGPYAHETQLVSPPVFSTYTTEPSTAPLTPPPELAHQTTPSSPDVPYARFLSSSMDFTKVGKRNTYMSNGYAAGSDLQAVYPLSPGSPSSSLISPSAGTPRTGASSPFPEQETATQGDVPTSSLDIHQWRDLSSKILGRDISSSRLSLDSSFFSSSNAYLDQAQQCSHTSVGRISISRDGPSKSGKQDVEEIEAYRASFGFSADEIITTPNYVEISDDIDISFVVPPLSSNSKLCSSQYPITKMFDERGKEATKSTDQDSQKLKPKCNQNANGTDCIHTESSDGSAGTPHASPGRGARTSGDSHASVDDMIIQKMLVLGVDKSSHAVTSCPDAEIGYRRSRSLKEASTRL